MQEQVMDGEMCIYMHVWSDDARNVQPKSRSKEEDNGDRFDDDHPMMKVVHMMVHPQKLTQSSPVDAAAVALCSLPSLCASCAG